MSEAPLSGPSGPSPATPAPPGASDADGSTEGEEPTGGLSLALYQLRRTLRTVEAERDGWKTEALALRARLGVPSPRDPYRKPKLGNRRVYLDDTERM